VTPSSRQSASLSSGPPAQTQPSDLKVAATFNAKISRPDLPFGESGSFGVMSLSSRSRRGSRSAWTSQPAPSTRPHIQSFARHDLL